MPLLGRIQLISIPLALKTSLFCTRGDVPNLGRLPPLWKQQLQQLRAAMDLLRHTWLAARLSGIPLEEDWARCTVFYMRKGLWVRAAGRKSGLLSAEALEALAGIECINKLQADAAELILPRLGTSLLTNVAVVSGMPQAAGRTPSTQVYVL